MAGLDPTIHVFDLRSNVRSWMPGNIGERSDAILANGYVRT
jgi:hypothetical protein